jgi:hypothetical protein
MKVPSRLIATPDSNAANRADEGEKTDGGLMKQSVAD